MLPDDAYTIREATGGDELALMELAALVDQPRITGPALIAEVGGIPTSAISLEDGRVVADPYQDTAQLVRALRAEALAARPSPARRMLEALRPAPARRISPA